MLNRYHDTLLLVPDLCSLSHQIKPLSSSFPTPPDHLQPQHNWSAHVRVALQLLMLTSVCIQDDPFSNDITVPPRYNLESDESDEEGQGAYPHRVSSTKHEALAVISELPGRTRNLLIVVGECGSEWCKSTTGQSESVGSVTAGVQVSLILRIEGSI